MFKKQTYLTLKCAVRLLLAIMLVLAIAAPVMARDEKVDEDAIKLILFWRDGCPHCEKEIEFLYELKKKYPRLEVNAFEVSESPENAKAFQDVMKKIGAKRPAVPATIIGNAVFMGFSEDTERGIEQQVRMLSNDLDEVESDDIVTLPFFGQIGTDQFSLPVFTVIIAGFDSFNPCALYILLFLLSLLIHAKSRVRMAIVGGVFVFISGLVYFLFMAAWLNIFFLIGRIALITTGAGIIALVVGSINVKDFFAFKKGVSLTMSDEASGKLIKRMRGLLNASSMTSMLIGTVVLATAANAYELLCTVGFPVIYTGVLTRSELSKLGYYMYLVLYNVVYVIPLLVVVLAFTFTLGSRKLTERQGRVLKLMSGCMMLVLGFVLVLKPELLNNIFATAGMLGLAVVICWLITMFFPGDDGGEQATS